MTNQTRNPRPPLGIRVTNATTAQLARLRVLERYDLSFIAERIVRENGSRPNSLSNAVLEFKRYMGLVALGYRGLPVPSQEVDDIWHAFLLFTREYAAFCRKTVGSFVHHIPTTSSGKTKLTKNARISRAYRKIFGLDMLTAGHCSHCSSCRTGSSARART
jgi:hypothetical protein